MMRTQNSSPKRTTDVRRAVRAAVAMVVALAVSAVLAPTAFGAPKGVVGYFNNDTNNVRGVAVNSNPTSPWFGDVYVVDRGNERVQRFSSLGEFERMWGRDVIKSDPEVDPDLGTVFEICTFADDCKQGAKGLLGGELDEPQGIAVDQASGDVYVVERSNSSGGARVQKFTGDGEFVWMLGKDSITDGSPSDPGGVTGSQVCTAAADCKGTPVGTLGGEFGQAGFDSATGGGTGVAVVPTGIGPLLNAGNVVVTDRGNQRVQEFTPSGGFVRAFGWDTITDASPSDPGSDTAFQICTVAADCRAGSAGANVGQFGANAPNRVAVDSTGAIYTVESSANRRVQKFTPQAGPPALSPAVVNPNIGGSGPALDLTGVGGTTSPMDIAVGPGDHVFVLRAFRAGDGTPPAIVAERRVVELTDTGVFEETHAALGTIGNAINVAVNSETEDIYMTTSSGQAFSGAGVYVLDPPPPPPTASLGVDSVSTHSAQLDGLINPNGPGTRIGIDTLYRFEYRQVGAPSWIPLSGDKSAGNDFSTLSVTETLTGLTANTAYEARIVVFRPYSGLPPLETTPETFTTPASRPDIDSVSVSDRGSTTATLNAGINPNGEATSYRFEYGPTAAYGTTVPAPDGNAGSGTASQIFSEAIAGLQPGTTYHYRVTATNVNGTNTSTDRAFTTQPTAPDPQARGYELVSPPDKTGGSGLGTWYSGIASHSDAGFPANDGDRFAPSSAFGGSLADGAFSYGSDWTLAQRAPTGWANKPAFNRIGGLGTPELAKLPSILAASDDLSLTAWAGRTQMSIFEEQALVWGDSLNTVNPAALREWDSGRWEIAAPVHPDQQVGIGPVDTRIAADGGYALISGPVRGAAGPGDPTGLAFVGGPRDWVAAGNGNVYIDDVTAGLSDAFPGGGVRSLVNVCTGEGADRTEIPLVDGAGNVIPGACLEDEENLAGRDAWLISPRGASLGAEGATPGSISDDGSRVFFMAPDHRNAVNHEQCSVAGAIGTKCPPQVYVSQRNPDGTKTVRWISKSAVGGQDSGLLASAVFEGATSDGDKAFFRTASPLTPDDPNGGPQVPGGVTTGSASPDSMDLYMYDFPNAPGADPGDGTLTRISAGPTGAADANALPGDITGPVSALRAFGSEGERVYFTTAAPVAGADGPGNGTITAPGGTVTQTVTRNLYLYDQSQPAETRWRFIAQLPASSTFGVCAAKGAAPAEGGLRSGPQGNGVMAGAGAANCVRTVGDGSLAAFFTDGRLTADDPDSATGDVYAYDAFSDELVRVSRPQGGAPGTSHVCVTAGPGTGTQCHGDMAISSGFASGQVPLNLEAGSSSSSDRVMFFESASRLVPEDVNDVYDVYEWRSGVLSLLSTGLPDAEDALYRGNDRSGTNVYISTRDRWSWQDHDAVLDVYVARKNSDGIPPPPPPPGCQLIADNCRPPGPAPTPTPPAGTGGSGDGNADPGVRMRLSVGAVSAAGRRAAARSGVLKVHIRVNTAGRVVAVAKGQIGKRVRRVARKSIRVDAGRATVKLRLSRVARRHLRSGKALRLRVSFSSPGAVSRSITVRLSGAKS
jgi:hypothetical protein